jgi:hypothetical protein
MYCRKYKKCPHVLHDLKETLQNNAGIIRNTQISCSNISVLLAVNWMVELVHQYFTN